MRLSNSNLKLNLTKTHLNRRGNQEKTKITNLNLKEYTNLLRETRTANLTSLNMDRINKIDQDSTNKMMKCQDIKVKTTDQIQTINMREDQIMRTRGMTTMVQRDTEINKILKDSQGNRTTKNSIKNTIIAETQIKSRVSTKGEIIIEEEIKDQITIKIRIMIKEETQEKRKDSLSREDQTETINKIKTQEVQENTKMKTINHKETNVNKRKLISLTHS